ncbi:TPA: hypothetical protein P6K22_002615 [Staphylococcus aureus]|nr:hypothetical protein [Staphylococcus aureus]
MTLSGKISVKAETIAHVVKELESISQKYDEIAQNFGKIAQLNYYSSEKASHSMENGYSSAATVIGGLKGPLSTLGGGVMNSAQKFFEADEHWGTEFAKLYYNIEG